VGHEVLWVIRECLSGEVLLARTLLSAKGEDLAVLLSEVKEALVIPIAGVISDGQQSIHKAVEVALPRWLMVYAISTIYVKLPNQFRSFPETLRNLRRKELMRKGTKKRGVRAIERSVAGSDDQISETVRDYCLAVGSALTHDGRPPLEASGLKWKD